jgi:hypothetical protein
MILDPSTIELSEELHSEKKKKTPKNGVAMAFVQNYGDGDRPSVFPQQ